MTPEYFMDRDADNLPGMLDIKVTDVKKGTLKAQLEVSRKHLSINGFLHAGTLIHLPIVLRVMVAWQTFQRVQLGLQRLN